MYKSLSAGLAIAVGAAISVPVSASAADAATTSSVNRSVDAALSQLGMAPLGGAAVGDLSRGMPIGSISVAATDAGGAIGSGSRAVFRGSRHLNYAVESDGSSTRIAAVMMSEGASARQTYTVSLPAGGRLTRDEGGVAVLNRKGRTVAVFESPWAVDSKGRSLQTSYRLEGNRIVQETDVRGAAFPVVADPKVRKGWWRCFAKWRGPGYCKRLSLQRTLEINHKVATMSNRKMIPALCKLGRDPRVVVACIALLKLAWWDFKHWLQKAADRHQCLRLRVGPPVPGLGWRSFFTRVKCHH